MFHNKSTFDKKKDDLYSYYHILVTNTNAAKLHNLWLKQVAKGWAQKKLLVWVGESYPYLG